MSDVHKIAEITILTKSAEQIAWVSDNDREN